MQMQDGKVKIRVDLRSIIYYNKNKFVRFNQEDKFMKKKGIIVLAVVAAFVVIIVASVAGTYNGLIERQQKVEQARSVISTQLQRRADLIPNFTEAVKSYTDYEKSTYTAVTEARSDVLKASTVSEQNAASDRLDSAISVWLNAVTEAYPELKADTQYTALTDELAGTENRIAKARKDYNEYANEYNVAVKKFPKNIVASLFGFDTVDYFEASEDSTSVPKVSFD